MTDKKRRGPLIVPALARSGRRAIAQIFRREVSQEVDDEFEFHLQMRISELRENGLSESDAYTQALASFGNIDEVKRHCRRLGQERDGRMRKRMWIDRIWQDIRYTLRQLDRARGFSAVAILTLALGIGANTAIFSFIDHILLRPLPYPEPDELVQVMSGFSSPGNFLDLEEQATTLTHVSAANNNIGNLTEEGQPQELQVASVSVNHFNVLGLNPFLGRFFVEEDDLPGASAVTVLSHGFWTRVFGADSALVGSTISIDGEQAEVIGIAPPEVARPFLRDLWTPLNWTAETETQRNSRFLFVYGRLTPEATLESARSELTALHGRISEEFPGLEDGFSARVQLTKDAIVSSDRPLLLMLGGASLLVLIIVCTNVAHLILARSEGRTQEFAVRSALGVGRGRLVSQLLTESLVLGALGGVAGIALAYLGVAWLVRVFGDSLARSEVIGIDLRVLGFTLGLSLITGVLVGLAPALQARHIKPQAELARGSGRSSGRSRLRTALLISEVALALVLVAGAGLFLKSFLHFYDLDLGFDPDQAIASQVSLPGYRYSDQTEWQIFFQNYLDEVRGMPGITSAALVSKLPATPGRTNVTRVNPVGSNEPEVNWVERRIISPGYFETMEIPLVAGRDFTDSDRLVIPDELPEDPVEMPVVVSRNVAEGLFPDSDPMGQLIWSDQLEGLEMRIAGIVENTREFGPLEPAPPILYVSHLQFPRSGLFLMVRSEQPLGAMSTSLQQRLQEADPLLFFRSSRTMRDVVSDSTGDPRLMVSLLGLFAGLALVLSAIGIYGVTSYTTAQRTREVGIRMALGAESSQVTRKILGEGVRSGALGILAGLGGVVALKGVVRNLLSEDASFDFAIYAAVAATLVLVVLAACYIPARRAAATQPVEALRGS